MPTIGVTGASGFVGSHLLRSFAARGWSVVAFGRDPRRVPAGYEFRAYDMDAGFPATALMDVDVLVHGAFVRASSTAEGAAQRNIRATSFLCDASAEAGTRLVFLSSMLARGNSKSEYGRHKFESEAILAERGALIVRPGLVVGDGGLIRMLFLSLRRGFVPLIDGGTQLIPIVGTDDLASAIAVALDAGLIGRQTVCADPVVAIAEIARTLAERFELRPHFLPVPWNTAYFVARLAERLGLVLPITTESLLGMRGFETEAPSEALALHGFRARTWPELLPLMSFAPLDGIPAQARE